jgi:hypothetical protein
MQIFGLSRTIRFGTTVVLVEEIAFFSVGARFCRGTMV